ncbi:MAG: tRNA (guanosine(46)-N7)-methyltransferase TrmB [Verrucomicrobiota bacterium]
MSNLKRNGQLRWAPSYLRNRGQLTRAQKRALRESWAEYGITLQHDETLDLDTYFTQRGPLIIEIGFGRGDHLVQWAKARPDDRILGIEVHRPGLAAAILKLREEELDNVRLIRGDARLVLTDHLVGEIADAMIVQFPDPWPKLGDEHRRLIQPGMAKTMSGRLKVGGYVQLITDITTYADHTKKVFQNADGWEAVDSSPFLTQRPITSYEQKALEAGRPIIELGYRKSEPSATSTASKD